MTTQELSNKYKYLVDYFLANNPTAKSELVFANGFQLLVAVILSAQCTDKRVNMTTPELFKRYPTPEALANSTVADIYELIKSISYPHNKAKHLNDMAKMLVADYQSILPDSMEELLKLPGVGRKTANVILSVIFDKPAMAVDTHVFRVANRLGIVIKATTPYEVEKQLVENIPQSVIPIAHHWLILHGRYVCLARKPQCAQCGLTSICDYFAQHALESK